MEGYHLILRLTIWLQIIWNPQTVTLDTAILESLVEFRNKCTQHSQTFLTKVQNRNSKNKGWSHKNKTTIELHLNVTFVVFNFQPNGKSECTYLNKLSMYIFGTL